MHRADSNRSQRVTRLLAQVQKYFTRSGRRWDHGVGLLARQKTSSQGNGHTRNVGTHARTHEESASMIPGIKIDYGTSLSVCSKSQKVPRRPSSLNPHHQNMPHFLEPGEAIRPDPTSNLLAQTYPVAVASILLRLTHELALR